MATMSLTRNSFDRKCVPNTPTDSATVPKAPNATTTATDAKYRAINRLRRGMGRVSRYEIVRCSTSWLTMAVVNNADIKARMRKSRIEATCV